MALNKLLAECLQLAWENMGDPVEWEIDDRDEYARDAHFISWKDMLDDFKEKVDFLGLDGLIEIDEHTDDAGVDVFCYGALLGDYKQARKSLKELIIKFEGE